MSVVKTPTSSLTMGQLLVNQIWYRTKAKIRQSLYGGVPEVSHSHPSPFVKLPQEVVENIISYFIHDRRTLLACSMTCYSWYIATVSHLHYSLTTEEDFVSGKYTWPRPLKESHKLGLLPLVKRFRIRLEAGFKFTPELLSEPTLHYFSALTNLQELGIDNLQVSNFMPNIRQCFGHLAPTLRFLALSDPNGSCREVLYFIGLFPNLQDLKINYNRGGPETKSAVDSTLIPLSAPPLRGCLTLKNFRGENLVQDMISFFRGLRFHHMNLFGVACMRLLLDACAESLKTLRVDPTDSYANLLDFDLSRNESLRTLEITARSISFDGDAGSEHGLLKASSFLKTILFSLASSVALDVVVIYQDIYPDIKSLHVHREQDPFCGGRRWISELEMDSHCFQHHVKLFREMYSMRSFRLILCVDAMECMVEQSVQTLEGIVKVEKEKGEFDFLLCEPLIVCERRVLRTHRRDLGGVMTNLDSAL